MALPLRVRGARPSLTRWATLARPNVLLAGVRPLSSGAGATLSRLLDRELKLEREEEERNGGAVTPELMELRDIVTQHMGISEEAGSNLVTLKMDFDSAAGPEKVKVFFNVQEYTNEEDLIDEPVPEEEDSAGNIYPFEVRVARGGRVMRFYCQANAQQFTVENVVVSKGDDIDADFDEKDAYQYQGPSFDDLEPDLQTAFIEFLNERYVDDTLACFIASYADYKEQQNYLQWLQDAEEFVKG
uniref:Mitochondrial glycoprotein n=1 Tax=Pinguiococcus pyrenoidosus TaxID=172671 RepID=A0A7R9YEN0_9STRA